MACLAVSGEFPPHPAGTAAAAGARMKIIADIDACSSPPRRRRRNTSQRPGPRIIGGAVPQTAAIPVVTRHCTPGS